MTVLEATRFSASGLRSGLMSTLPEAAFSTGSPPKPEEFFAPRGHLKLLGLDATLVVGARGVGKSVWAGVLTDSQFLRALQFLDPRLKKVTSTTGFSEHPDPDKYPDENIFRKLLTSGFDSEHIWRAVILRNLQENQDLGVPRDSWGETAEWVAENPEPAARAFAAADMELKERGEVNLFVFDALDRTARDWDTMDLILRGLFRVSLSLRSSSTIFTKVFLREDQLNRATTAFTDASKLTATMVRLEWPTNDLHSLLWKRLVNAPGGFGDEFRELFHGVAEPLSMSEQGIFSLPMSFQRNVEQQRNLFERLAGSRMGTGAKRGVPFTWMVGHLSDAAQRTSPRSFLTAVRSAAVNTNEQYPEHPLALHYESIKRGVQLASQVRVAELAEDYPWAEPVLESLRGLSVPCTLETLIQCWKNSFPAGPSRALSADFDALPPQHGASWDGIVEDLERLGMLEKLQDGRYNMPDLYRVGFGLKRYGGVKPMRRR